MQITKNKFTEVIISLYLIIIMASSSTGTLAVQGVRLITVAVLILFILSKKKGKVKIDKYTKLTIAFLIYNVIMCEFAFSRQYAVTYTATLGYVIVIDILANQYLTDKRNSIKALMLAEIIGSIVKALLDFGRLGIGYYLTHRSSAVGSANTIGFYSAVAVVFSWWQFKKSKTNNRYWFVLTGILSTAFVILSASRKALLYIALPIGVYLLLKSKNPLVILRNLAVVIIVACLGYLAIMNVGFLYNSIGHRIEAMLIGLSGGNGDGSTETRLYLIDFGLRYFKRKPLWGYGMSNFKALMSVYAPYRTTLYAHNNYIELLVDCGLVGTIMYYLLYVEIIKNTIARLKERNMLDIIFLGLLMSFIIAEFGLVTYNDPVQQFILLLMYINSLPAREKKYIYEENNMQGKISAC